MLKNSSLGTLISTIVIFQSGRNVFIFVNMELWRNESFFGEISLAYLLYAVVMGLRNSFAVLIFSTSEPWGNR
jgi:hypothetical protein